jgi:PAS domain S-box-containing protein
MIGRKASHSGGQEAGDRLDTGHGVDVSAPNSPDAGSPAESARTWRRDPISWAIVFVAVAFAGWSLWWVSRLGDATLSNRFIGGAAVPSGVLVTLGALRIRRSERLDPRTRRAWSIIGAAFVGYGCGALLHYLAGETQALSPLVPVGLALEVAAYPLVAIALVLLPKPARTRFDLALFSLDVAIVAWSSAMLTWHFFIFPVARDAGQGLVAAFGAAMFPVADLSLVFAIGAFVVRGLKESSRAAMAVACVALVFIFVGDMVSGMETLRGTYVAGGLSGFLYSIAWIGIAVAAYLQWRIKDSDRPMQGLADYARSFPWLPYVAVALAFIAPAIRDWNDVDMLRQHVPATGLLIGLVVARLSVTARQNASLAAAERERLAAAVDQASEAVLTTDRLGLVTYVNPAFTRITGYSAAEIVGTRADVLRGATDPARLAEMQATNDRGESWEGRVVWRRSDSATVELDMAIAPLLDNSGAVVGSVTLARDISRERALETQLAQAQRMEAVGRLAGGIAHDFNNILTAISGFAELATDEVSSDDPVAKDLDQILKASDRAAGLTKALLAFSRRQVMQPRLIDLNEVLGGLTPMIGRLLGEDLQLAVQLDPMLGLTMADRAQLEQVVLSLAVNARDAMPSGGSLTIATANVDLEVTQARAQVGAVAGPYVTLSVADTGVGMTPAVMEHAFEPFFTTKARGKGTGLGLSTVIGIVQQSGGFVRVESEPNAGSVFTVHLPRFDGAARPEEGVEPVSLPVGGDETILVAEDEDAVRQFVERVLTGAGYRVTAATHGADALTLADAMPDLDLLVTDVVMPGMSGVELAGHLAAIHPGLPVIYASGYSEEAILLGAVGEDRVPYLSKPFTAEALLALVREVLDRPSTRAAQTPSGAAGPE